MKLINQECHTLFQQYSNDSEEYLNLMYQHIEKCGRTCYHSSDKITSESAKPFFDRMVKSNHTAMLEHGTIYLKCPWNEATYIGTYESNPYSKVILKAGIYYITTNMRVIVENNWEKDLKYLCKPTEHHIKRYTLLCTTALHCYKDLTRHRKFSFAIESTRYCNYNNTKKFGEMTFIKPTWYEDSSMLQKYIFKKFLGLVEKYYKFFIVSGWQAQQSAEILPQCIKGDMVITGFEDDWKHLINLRYYGTTGAPHPMVKELTKMMKDNLKFINI